MGKWRLTARRKTTKFVSLQRVDLKKAAIDAARALGYRHEMTALRKYQRLEAHGLWRDRPEARLREVVVALRDATLILSDPKTEMALAQWSLPAMVRLNPGAMPAMFSPDADGVEMVELDDPEMIAALETVRVTLERRRARPGRLRGVIFVGSTCAVLALAVFWLPGGLMDYTATMLPAVTKDALGELALADMVKLTGFPCATVSGVAAAREMARRIDPVNPPRILIMRDGLTAPHPLPGDIVVLPAAMIDRADGPDAVAGFVIAEMLRAQAQDPTRAILNHAGLMATLRLLTSGAMSPDAVQGFGQSLLTAPAADMNAGPILAAFAAAKISATPYAYALDPSGEATLPLIEADGFATGSVPAVLNDAHWLELQSICAG